MDQCWQSGGYVPVGTCDCSHDYGGGGGGVGGGGGGGEGEGWCYWSDCSCSDDWECDTYCDSDGYCGFGLLDPVLIDLNGDGFAMTDAANGVVFNFFGQTRSPKVSWTGAGADDAWLVLDRNQNGKIDDGRELFSNVSPQFGPPASHLGFLALSIFDAAPAGGNGDGVIDRRDRIFSGLRLWQDINHNGISEPSELHTLPELGVESISLDYEESRRTDRSGNVFRYRAKVYGTSHRDLGRWAYDVILLASERQRGPRQDIALNDSATPLWEVGVIRPFRSRRLGQIKEAPAGKSFLQRINNSALLW